MKFKNKGNGFTEEKSVPWLWTLLFGAFYLIFCGAWVHVVMWFLLAIVFFASMGPPATMIMLVVNLIYSAFASSIVRNSYLRRGWIEVGEREHTKKENPLPSANEGMTFEEKTCPFCAETIKRKALVCKHCGRDQPVTKTIGGVELPPFSG